MCEKKGKKWQGALCCCFNLVARTLEVLKINKIAFYLHSVYTEAQRNQYWKRIPALPWIQTQCKQVARHFL